MTDPQYLIAVATVVGAAAAVIGGIASMIAAIGTFLNGRAALVNRKIGMRSVAASIANSEAIRRVDAKVDGVAENTNGHMTTLLAAVAPVDPALVASTMVKIQNAAEAVREKLQRRADNNNDEPLHDE